MVWSAVVMWCGVVWCGVCQLPGEIGAAGSSSLETEYCGRQCDMKSWSFPTGLIRYYHLNLLLSICIKLADMGINSVPGRSPS